MMTSNSYSQYPGVYYIRNRVALIIISILLIFWEILDLRGVIETHAPLILSIFWILIWSYSLWTVVRRRLVLTQEGFEYTDDFKVLQVNWSEVKYIETRKRAINLGWKTEGLVIRTDLPDGKEYFVDLMQFDRRWRTGPLGSVLQMKAPHLFQ